MGVEITLFRSTNAARETRLRPTSSHRMMAARVERFRHRRSGRGREPRRCFWLLFSPVAQGYHFARRASDVPTGVLLHATSARESTKSKLVRWRGDHGLLGVREASPCHELYPSE